MAKNTLSGGKLAGGNPANTRVEHDYYATNPKAVKMLLENYEFNGRNILEPCVGAGHIANAFNNFYDNSMNITGIDIVDRGYPNTTVTNFLTYETDKKWDGIITNPPYSMAGEFVEKGMSLLNENGQMAMFLKIQFLESAKRKQLFLDFPPKYVYVFSDRMSTWNNGQQINPETGKPWSTTFCHAWFVWEKGSKSEPIIKWL